MKSRMLIISAIVALAALFNLSLAASAQAVDTPAPSQNETELTSVEGIDIIEELALENWEEAMDVYSSFTKRMIREEAKSPADLQRLLEATLVLTELDGANEHYNILVDLWKAFPTELAEAVRAMPVELETKEDILATINSFADSLRDGNG